MQHSQPRSKRARAGGGPAGLLGVLLLGGLSACGGGATPSGPDGASPGSAPPDLPLPSNRAALDPGLAEQIQTCIDTLLEDPENAQSWMALAMTYEANDLTRLAIAGYEHVVAPEAMNTSAFVRAKAWSRIAQAHDVLGEVEPAIAAMRRSIELVPDYAPSHWRLGSYLFDWGDFAAARQSFRRATELDPRHSGGWVGLARLDLQEDHPESAVRILTSFLEKKPKDADALRLLRTAYTQTGRTEEAAGLAASWKRKSSPGKDPWLREFRAYREKPLMERALADLQGGKPAEAVEVLEDFAKDHPEDLNVLSFLAWGRYLTGDESGARESIEQGLAVDPDSVLILRVLARMQESSGDPTAAIATLRRLLAVDRNDSQSLRKCGRLLVDAGDEAGAVELWTRFLELDGSDSEIWRKTGETLLSLGRFTDAETTFRAALRHRVTGAAVRAGLARALAGEGRWEEAEQALLGGGELDAPGRVLLESIRAHSL